MGRPFCNLLAQGLYHAWLPLGLGVYSPAVTKIEAEQWWQDDRGIGRLEGVLERDDLLHPVGLQSCDGDSVNKRKPFGGK